jgi:NADH:ubiquinone oxidoreductase subunit K
VFTLGNLGESTFRDSVFRITQVYGLIDIYLEKSLKSLLPTFPIASLVLFIALVRGVFWLPETKRWFFGLWFFAPFGLFLWHTRNNLHILIGIEMMLVILIVVFLNSLKTKTKRYYFPIAAILLLAYSVSQIQLANSYRNNRLNTFSIQSGAFLVDQLALLDKTYQIADGKPFSISSHTNPLGYNITWSYLYDWYGLKTYGYKPVFYGHPQAGLFGEGLLLETSYPLDVHFSIIESGVVAPPQFFNQFMSEQNKLTMVEEYEFGSILLQHRTTPTTFLQ